MANDKLPVFEIEIDSDDALGVDAVALVGSPAIMVNWVAQSADGQKYEKRWVMQSERHELTGPLSIPNQLIFRDGPEGPHYITYSASTIRQMAERFLERGNQLNLNVEHEPDRKVQAVVMESWIKEGDNDKSSALGYDLPDGTWMITVKVKDERFWQEQIKTGKVKGFSLEGYFGQDLKRYEYQSINPADQPMNQVQQASVEKQFAKAFKDAVSQLKKYKNSKTGQTLLARLEKESGFDYFISNTKTVLSQLAKAEDEEKQSKQKKQSAQAEDATSMWAWLKQQVAPKQNEQLTAREREQLKQLLSRVKQADIADMIEAEAGDAIAGMVEDAVEDVVEDVIETIADTVATGGEMAVEQMTMQLADGGEVFIDDSNVAYIDGDLAPEGDYALADGGTLRVGPGGSVIEIVAADAAVSQLAQIAQKQAAEIEALRRELAAQKKQQEKQQVKQTQAPKAKAPARQPSPSFVRLSEGRQNAVNRRLALYEMSQRVNQQIRQEKQQQQGGKQS